MSTDGLARIIAKISRTAYIFGGFKEAEDAEGSVFHVEYHGGEKPLLEAGIGDVARTF